MKETWSDLGIDISKVTGKQAKVLCPKCSSSRKKKNEKCLSVNLELGTYYCFNCHWNGGLKANTAIRTSYLRPLEVNILLDTKASLWLLERGISINTQNKYKITSAKKKLPQVEWKERNCICFPYYRENELINVKYRDGEKNFMLEKGAELIFYGMDVAKGYDEIVITEGEIDTMSVYESGVPYVVSVPNGAVVGNNSCKYLDNCHEYFTDKRKIILATDNDVAGITLKEELARRLDISRCYYVDFGDCKDANEYLLKHGNENLKKLIENAQPFPVKGVIFADDVRDEVDFLYEFGHPETLKLGFKEFDDLIKWVFGRMIVITGIPNSGKSQFLDQLLLLLAAKYKWKIGYFSAEKKTPYHIAKLIQLHTGRMFFSKQYKMSREIYNKSMNFIHSQFMFLDTLSVDLTVDGLIAKASEMVLKYGMNAFVIDPFNYVEHQIPHGYSETQYINEALSKLWFFKNKYNVDLFIVAHPTKIKKEENGKYKIPTLYDINGSAAFFNKTDVGMTVYRDFDTNEVSVYVQKIREEWYGKIGNTKFTFDFQTGRYSQSGENKYKAPIDKPFEDWEMQEMLDEERKFSSPPPNVNYQFEPEHNSDEVPF